MTSLKSSPVKPLAVKAVLQSIMLGGDGRVFSHGKSFFIGVPLNANEFIIIRLNNPTYTEPNLDLCPKRSFYTPI